MVHTVEKGYIDVSAAQELASIRDRLAAGELIPLEDSQGGVLRLGANKAGKANYPTAAAHEAANSLAAKALAQVPQHQVEEAAAEGRLPFFSRPFGATTGGTYPAAIEQSLPAYTSFLRTRLGAVPTGAILNESSVGNTAVSTSPQGTDALERLSDSLRRLTGGH